MRRTVFTTPVISWFFYGIAWCFLKVIRWRPGGKFPDAPKFVLIGAPHTSNWDAFLVIAFAFIFHTEVFWMAKKSAFRFPFGPLLRWMGGIPIDRSKHTGVVAQTIDMFNKADRMIVCIPPEGTRGRTKYWKTGFYRVAHGAGIPICMGFLDFKKRCGGFGPMLEPTGDIEADFNVLREYYATITAKYPELYSEPRVAPESLVDQDHDSGPATR